MDDRQWRVAIHPGDGPGVAYLGFEVADGAALASAAAELAAAGATVTIGEPQEAAARGVQGLVWCSDPAGNRVELFYGAITDFHFRSPFDAEFLTGGLGLGHALLLVPDVDLSLDFYCGKLGFRRTDFIKFGPGMSAHFLRCTARHHSIGLVRVGDFAGVNHVMFEMTELDGVGQALDRALRSGAQITSTLGRHANDRMVSFYVRSPAGFDVEIGWSGMLIDDDTWRDREFVEGDTWGHAGLTAEALQATAG
jgi:3,4-dihydroxy-9,10-secoandrosta-1,3,5(10)-triene-9,17-dione 4,5-dioxygenase